MAELVYALVLETSAARLKSSSSSCPPLNYESRNKSQKGLRTNQYKKNIEKKIDERLKEIQKEVALKGFRPGKVPPALIKSQFGKSIYGEVIDKILRETTTKAIDEKLRVAGQPKIDLKQFGEGKDLNYEPQIDCLPSVSLKSFDKFLKQQLIKLKSKVK